MDPPPEAAYGLTLADLQATGSSAAPRPVCHRNAEGQTCSGRSMPGRAWSDVALHAKVRPGCRFIQQQEREIKVKDVKFEKIIFELARLKACKFSAKTEMMSGCAARSMLTMH